MGMPGCACIPPDGEDWSGRWIKECEYHAAMRRQVDTLGGVIEYIRAAAGEVFAADAAINISLLAKERDEARAENERLREALRVVMDYPKIRTYLGSEVSDFVDAARRGGAG